MSKQQILQRRTEVPTQDGVGKQLENSLTVDDSYLPSPQELAAYKEINPDIVKFLIDSAASEQAHRHLVDKEKLSIIKKSDRRAYRINWWGMAFAFLSVLALAALSGYALKLDRLWFAGFLSAGTIVTVVSLFDRKGNSSGSDKRRT